MDYGDFDVLTRSVANGGSSRRAALRLLAGGAPGTLAARLGLTEDAEAKPKRQRKRRPERKPQDALQAEGKGKKKGRGKKKGKPAPTCGPGKKPCPDGSCVSQALCCPGQKKCGDGECIPEKECCPDAPTPLCGDCQEAVCDNGEYACRPTTPPPCGGECEEAVCDNGEWACRPMSRVCRFPEIYRFHPEVCQCVRWCDNGFCPPHYEGCGWNGLCESSDPNLPATCATNHTQCRSRLCCRYGCCGSGCCPPPTD